MSNTNQIKHSFSRLSFPNVIISLYYDVQKCALRIKTINQLIVTSLSLFLALALVPGLWLGLGLA